MTIIKFTEEIPSDQVAPDERLEVTHYVSEHTALRVCDQYYTGYTGGDVYIGTVYAKHKVSEAPHDVLPKSADAYIEQHRSYCSTPVAVDYEDLLTEIQPFFKSEFDLLP